MTAGLALAADTVSGRTDPRRAEAEAGTRGLSAGPQVDTAAQTRKRPSSTACATARPGRSRSVSVSRSPSIAANKPKIDLEIHFDYNSAEISKASMPAVQELGKALSNPSLKGSTFVVAGHTDAVGGETYNQDLSERRADTIKRYLVEKYGLTGSDLVTVGYGKTKLKDTANPADPLNRRVQVVNMETKTASKQ